MTYFKSLNSDHLRQDLDTSPWSICGTFDDVGYVAWACEYLYKYIMNERLKSCKVKVRTNGLMWMNSNIIKEMNRRYVLLRKVQRNPSDTDAWKRYSKKRNLVTKITREAEAEYWKVKF